MEENVCRTQPVFVVQYKYTHNSLFTTSLPLTYGVPNCGTSVSQVNPTVTHMLPEAGATYTVYTGLGLGLLDNVPTTRTV